MKLLSTALGALLASVLLAGEAFAHFIWIHVLDADSGRVAVYFGEGLLERSDPGMVRNLAGLKLIQNGELGAVELTGLEFGDFAASARLPVAGRPVRAELTYGWMGGPDSGSLLVYHAVGARTLADLEEPSGSRLEILAHRVGDSVDLRVLFDGRPASGAEVVFTDELVLDKPRLETDENGELRLPIPRSGPLLVRAKVVESDSGRTYEGRAASEVLHYATLSVADPVLRELPEGGQLIAHQRLERALALEDCWGGEVQKLVGRCRVLVDDQAAEEFALSYSARDGLRLSSEEPAVWQRFVEAQLVSWYAELGGLAYGDWLEVPVTEASPGVPGTALLLGTGERSARVELEKDTLRTAEFSGAGTDGIDRVHTVLDILARESTSRGKSFVRAAAVTRRTARDGAWLGTDLISNTLSERTGTLLPSKREIRRSTPEGETRIRIELSGLELRPLESKPQGTPPSTPVHRAPANTDS